MYIVDKKLISSEVFSQKFVCNLEKCRGACCWEGDYGAPLDEAEVDTIAALLPMLSSWLSQESKSAIEEQGHVTYSKLYGGWVTPLLNNGACAYLVKDADGIARCSFEILYNKGETDFKKPISCHLYPIRVSYNPRTGFEALNYDEWDICSAACQLGEELKVPVFKFVKEALIRKYGSEFYKQVEDIGSTYFSEGLSFE